MSRYSDPVYWVNSAGADKMVDLGEVTASLQARWDQMLAAVDDDGGDE